VPVPVLAAANACAALSTVVANPMVTRAKNDTEWYGAAMVISPQV
jgi:hypothetical protein